MCGVLWLTTCAHGALGRRRTAGAVQRLAEESDANFHSAVNRFAKTRTASFSHVYMRDVSCDQRHAGWFKHWSKPDARRESHHDRGGDARQYARTPGPVDQGSAVVQGRHED